MSTVWLVEILTTAGIRRSARSANPFGTPRASAEVVSPGRAASPRRAVASITDRECRKKDELNVIANLFSIYQPDQHHAGNQGDKTTEAQLDIIDHVELTHNSPQKCRKKGIYGALKSQHQTKCQQNCVNQQVLRQSPVKCPGPSRPPLLWQMRRHQPELALRFRGTAQRSGFCHWRSAC